MQSVSPYGPTSQSTAPRGYPNYRHAAVQTDPRLLLRDPAAAQPRGPSFRAGSEPGPRLPVSDHAAVYLAQWNAGRAAHSSRLNATAAHAPATQIDHPRSPVPAPHPRSTTGVQDAPLRGIDKEEAAEGSAQAPNAPLSVVEASTDADIVMGGVDAKVVKDDESPPGKVRAPEDNAAGSHGRGEKEGGLKTSKTAGALQGTKAEARVARSGIKKGVARVKKPEPKGRKSTRTARGK